jgi:hypothetical protein
MTGIVVTALPAPSVWIAAQDQQLVPGEFTAKAGQRLMDG